MDLDFIKEQTKNWKDLADIRLGKGGRVTKDLTSDTKEENPVKLTGAFD